MDCKIQKLVQYSGHKIVKGNEVNGNEIYIFLQLFHFFHNVSIFNICLLKSIEVYIKGSKNSN